MASNETRAYWARHAEDVGLAALNAPNADDRDLLLDAHYQYGRTFAAYVSTHHGETFADGAILIRLAGEFLTALASRRISTRALPPAVADLEYGPSDVLMGVAYYELGGGQQ